MKKPKVKKGTSTIKISKICSDAKCNRVGVVARKLSDFWLTVCEGHIGKQMTIDFKKVGR